MNGKKVLIVTLCGYKNYGNRLQNYALQEVIKKMGYHVESLWTNPDKISGIQYFKAILKILIKKINKNFKTLETKKTLKFKKFNDKYLNIVYDLKDVLNRKKIYDYYVVGSDQIWNYTFNDFSDLYFLNFADKSKTMSYAGSFGVDKIESDYIEKFKRGLSNLSQISVRESSGKKIINDLIKKQVPVVLDPTLLLSTKEWEKLERCPLNFYNGKYILLCFLGKIDDTLLEKIDNMAKKNNYKIITLFSTAHENFYAIDPNEFIYYIHNAQLVLTDSYHCTIFSIIFKKNFYVFERKQNGKSMISRINTLLNTFKLSNRKVENFCECTNVDYTDIEKILMVKRKESINFINNSFRLMR